jgi:hypothetical protein
MKTQWVKATLIITVRSETTVKTLFTASSIGHHAIPVHGKKTIFGHLCKIQLVIKVRG